MALTSNSPAYKTASSPGAAAPVASGLASMFGSLIGGNTPTYKTTGEQPRQAPASSPGLLRIIIGSPPSYKTAPMVTEELDDGSDADDCGNVDDADDEADVADNDAAPTNTVIVL
ncbi:MAG: hypothetical protein QM831_21965 [Kofleriaceae bacterium]